MTVATHVNRSGPYLTNGVTTEFSYGFKIFDEDDLEVWKQNTTSGARTVLTKTTDYTVSGVGEDAGGIVTIPGPLASGFAITIRRAQPWTQLTALTNLSLLEPGDLEKGLDKIVMAILRMKDWRDDEHNLPRYTIATLPTAGSGTESRIGWVSDGLKPGEAEGSGTGMVYYDAGVYGWTPLNEMANFPSIVTNGTLADMDAATIKGRASGAGTGSPQDLTATQAREIVGLGGSEIAALGVADTSGGSLTIETDAAVSDVSGIVITDATNNLNLPASPPDGRVYVIKNNAGEDATIGRNGKKVDGEESNYTLPDGESRLFWYHDDTGDWVVF